MDVLISIVAAVLLAEGYAWLPRLSDWLVEHAVSQLVRDEQDRYRENGRHICATFQTRSYSSRMRSALRGLAPPSKLTPPYGMQGCLKSILISTN
jgi:hypothetical protein